MVARMPAVGDERLLDYTRPVVVRAGAETDCPRWR